jgi:Flp pilus assembly protein protease CpaA
MIPLIFLILMLIFCVTDLKYMHISNWIVLPAIVLGIYLTKNWLPALVMFSIGAMLFNKNLFAGGDVKLITMAGAFLGWWALLAFLLSKFLVFYFRARHNEQGALPYAPFLFIGSLPFLFL